MWWCVPGGGADRCLLVSSAADVLIIGAGIAGCEAAWRCAAAGLEVLLVTTSLDTVYNLASDAASLAAPSGSLMAEVMRDMPSGAGAVRSRDLHRGVKYALEAATAIHLLQSTVSRLLFDERGAVVGAGTWEGVDRLARTSALCVGSFLRARLRTGAVTETQGRLSEMAYDDLYERLAELGFEFVPVSFTGEPHGGSLAYVVESVALARSERGGSTAGTRTAGLWRAPGLFAAGVCVSPAAPGTSGTHLSYEEVAKQGMALGSELVAWAGSDRGSVGARLGVAGDLL